MSKKVIIGMLIITAVLLTVFAMRSFTNEDGWICEEGIWIKHGNPSQPMPKEQCNKVK